MRIQLRGRELVIPLTDAQARQIAADLGMEFELVRVREGVYVFAGAGPKANPLDEKIFSLLAKKRLNERVEGMFEKLLEKEELERFKELLKEGGVELFKLSEKYKKGVYRLPEGRGGGKAQEKTFNVEREAENIEEFSLEGNGLMVVKNELRAKKISDELAERIKREEVKGIRAFDGTYYIIDAVLYEKLARKFLEEFKRKTALNASDLSESLGVGREFVKAVAEFLKEDGDIIERRAGIYCLVEGEK